MGLNQTDVFMETDGFICKINLKKALLAIGGSYKSAVLRKKSSLDSVVAFEKQNEEEKEKSKKITLENLVFIKKVGEGQFGQVFLVKDKDDPQVYALKAVSKQQIFNENLTQYVLVSSQGPF